MTSKGRLSWNIYSTKCVMGYVYVAVGVAILTFILYFHCILFPLSVTFCLLFIFFMKMFHLSSSDFRNSYSYYTKKLSIILKYFH